jgi:hypothetical protein
MGGPQAGAQGQAAYIHQGPPERYDEEDFDDGATDYDHGGTLEDHDGGEDGEAHYCYGRDCDHPCHSHHAANAGPHQYGSFASSGNDYIPTNAPGQAGMPKANSKVIGATKMSRNGQQPTRNGSTNGNVQYQRSANGVGADDEFQQYLRQLEQGDQQVQQSKLEKEVADLRKVVGELKGDKVKYARADQLRILQTTTGVDLDVAEEVADTIHLSDDQFGKYIEKVKIRYQRDPSKVELIRTTETGGPKNSPESRMSGDQVKQYARSIGARAAELRSTGNGLSEADALKKAKEEIDAQMVAA